MSETDEELYQRLDAEHPCPRCAELESEVARLREDLRETGATLQAEIKCGDAMGTRLESTCALLRELAAPARLAALERLIKIARLALSWGMADKDDCPNEFGADVNEAAVLLNLLRRAESAAGEGSEG